MKWFNLAKKLI
ncbi:hypothetical protein B4U80_01066 [Leptotrombidium deliense]|uniref:Uncharacterized protein n=1 Tax=Leptotrombidium deliense TaxID=299467 RepID=A0A443RVU2_9ACAR|nr:hypothetical protein B4U80_01066 [Leptotrombidium deliense]